LAEHSDHDDTEYRNQTYENGVLNHAGTLLLFVLLNNISDFHFNPPQIPPKTVFDSIRPPQPKRSYRCNTARPDWQLLSLKDANERTLDASITQTFTSGITTPPKLREILNSPRTTGKSKFRACPVQDAWLNDH
jgi:hypothetical protein